MGHGEKESLALKKKSDSRAPQAPPTPDLTLYCFHIGTIILKRKWHVCNLPTRTEHRLPTPGPGALSPLSPPPVEAPRGGIHTDSVCPMRDSRESRLRDGLGRAMKRVPAGADRRRPAGPPGPAPPGCPLTRRPSSVTRKHRLHTTSSREDSVTEQLARRLVIWGRKAGHEKFGPFKWAEL